MSKNSQSPYEIIQSQPEGHCLSSLIDFEEKMVALREWREKTKTPYHLLFRGQADADWALKTTLERKGHNLDFDCYLYAVRNCLPEIQTYTGESWSIDLPEDGYVGKYFQTEFSNSNIYRYFAWLRHYGFPSPLLDWSQSEYIALYFALREQRENTDAAFYVYLRSCKKHGQVTGSSKPTIYSFGHTVHVNERHMAQQGEYTLCACQKENMIKFCAHDEGVVKKDQDLIWKFTLPFDLRNELLEKLMKMNIYSYTLFQTTNALA